MNQPFAFTDMINERLAPFHSACELAFNSHSYFNKCFIKQYNISPKDYRKNPANISASAPAV